MLVYVVGVITDGFAELDQFPSHRKKRLGFAGHVSEVKVTENIFKNAFSEGGIPIDDHLNCVSKNFPLQILCNFVNS